MFESLGGYQRDPLEWSPVTALFDRPGQLTVQCAQWQMVVGQLGALPLKVLKHGEALD